MTYTVVGGGIAGLTAAVELARNGAKVRLIEQHKELGGRAATTDKDGFALNLGPHAVYLDGHLHKTLSAWGIMPEGGRPVLAGRASMVKDGRRHAFVRDLPSLVTCSFLSPMERIEAGRVWGKLTGPGRADGLTMTQWLDRETKSASVRGFIEALIRLSTYCDQPHLQDANAVLDQLALGRAGVTYVNGGWGSMIRDLERHARSLNVEIQTGDPAERGDILAVAPSEVQRITGAALAPLTPIRMATLDIALDGLPKGAAVFGLGLDQPLYLSIHSEWAAVAPLGKSTVHVAKYLGGAPSDAGCDRAQLEAFADLLMPGWRERVHHVRFLPEMTVTHSVVGVGGRPDVDALGSGSPRLAGDWVGPDGMLADAAAASGVRAARSLLS